MSFLRNLFGSKESSHVSEKKVKTSPYIPAQREPEEYTHYVSELVALTQQNQLDCLVLIIGFDDSEKISTVLQKSKALGLQTSSVKEGPIFKQRNPVIEYRYPLDFNQDSIIQDADKLKAQGGTDLSAVGITMATALKLRDIFGQKSCPFLAPSQ